VVFAELRSACYIGVVFAELCSACYIGVVFAELRSACYIYNEGSTRQAPRTMSRR
jgi:hypothetical protein